MENKGKEEMEAILPSIDDKQTSNQMGGNQVRVGWLEKQNKTGAFVDRWLTLIYDGEVPLLSWYEKPHGDKEKGSIRLDKYDLDLVDTNFVFKITNLVLNKSCVLRAKDSQELEKWVKSIAELADMVISRANILYSHKIMKILPPKYQKKREEKMQKLQLDNFEFDRHSVFHPKCENILSSEFVEIEGGSDLTKSFLESCKRRHYRLKKCLNSRKLEKQVKLISNQYNLAYTPSTFNLVEERESAQNFIDSLAACAAKKNIFAVVGGFRDGKDGASGSDGKDGDAGKHGSEGNMGEGFQISIHYTHSFF